MLTIKNVMREDDSVITDYTTSLTVETAGDGLWGCEAGRVVNVTGVRVVDYTEEDYKMLYVEHDSEWNIYTDSAFEQAISELMGYDVSFTEQGMQDDELASMET